MKKIIGIYNSFIPYLALFVAMLIFIGFMDRYAERVAKAPEIIVVGAPQDNQESDMISWHMGEETGSETRDAVKEDSIFQAARTAFSEKKYNQAKVLFSLLSNSYPNAAIPYNYLGIIAVRENNIPAAIDAFRNAANADTLWHEAKANLASVLNKAKRIREAEQLYRDAIRLQPNDPDVHYNLGLMLLDESNPDGAIESFRKAVDLSSGKKKARAYSMMGIAQMQKLDTAAARIQFNEAILLWPDYEFARLNYARTSDDPEQQLEEFQKIYRLNSRSYHANHFLARYYQDEDDPARAEFHYRKALDQDPSNTGIIEELANILIDQNRISEAELVIEGFVAGDTLPQSYFMQAKIASRHDQAEEAMRLYELAIDKSGGTYPEAFVNLAILQKTEGWFAESINSYRRAIEVRPNYALAYYNLGLMYTETDSIEQAIQAYRQSVRLDSSSFKSWYNLGRLYDRTLENDLEIEAYRNALSVKPDYTRALLELGNAYLDVRDYSQAIEAYKNLLSIYPKYTKAWFNLGLSHTRIDQDEEAIMAYENLLQIDPEHIQGSINLSELYDKTGNTGLAVLTMEEVVSVDMDNPEIRRILGSFYEKDGRMNDASYQYLRLIDLEPDEPDHYEKLMQIYRELGDTAHLAMTNFRKHKNLELEYDFYEAAKDIHEMGMVEFALDAYRYVQGIGNNSKWVEYWIGKAHMDLLELNKAIPQFETVLELDREHKFAWYRLGQVYDLLGKREIAETYYEELRSLDDQFKIVRRNALE